jgi:GntR family transcriptional regulator
MSDRHGLPKYIQISEMLIREIAAGHLADGARLPPEREMASRLDISVGTLRKALSDLAKKNLLESIQGSGNYIRAGKGVDSVYAFLRLEKTTGGGLPTAEILSVDLCDKPDAPDFGPAQQGHRIRRLRSLDMDVVALEEIWLDASYAERLDPLDLSDSLYLHYKNALGLIVTRVEDQVSLSMVPDWSDPRFALAPKTPSAYIERVSWDQKNQPAEFSRTWFDTDKARYIARLS